MTKHIVGLIIFTLIVGTSVVIAGLFGYSSASNSYSQDKYRVKHRVYKKKKRKKRCRKKRKRHHKKHSFALMTQAVFDKETNELTSNLTFTRNDFNGLVVLHFFVNDEFGPQYLKKETISVSFTENTYESSFSWLNRLESRENLYIMPIVNQSKNNNDYQPRFDPNVATPVLLK